MPSSDTSLAVFSYIGQDVRTVQIDGQTWFVAVDVARVLEIDNIRPSLAALDDDEKGVSSIDTLGGLQNLAVVSEAGLYSLILRSRKPQAREFKRWVTHVVLPEIRQTGSFAPVRALPHDFATALRELLSEVESHEETKAELAEIAPRADAWDALASAEGDYSVGDAAKILARAGVSTGPLKLFAQMEAMRWTFRGSDNRPRAYADRVEKGFLAEKPSFHYHPGTGERVVDPPQVRVTVKGLERLRQRMNGSMAVAS